MPNSPTTKQPRCNWTGVDVRTTPSRRVEFVCPRCGVDREGVVLQQQRWVLVLRIPMVPLAMVDPTVQCYECGHRAGIGVLEVLTSRKLAEYLAVALRYAIASVVRAGITDGSGIGPDVVDEAFDVMLASGYGYDEMALAGDLAAVDDAATARALQPLADELTPHGKQGFLNRMIAIALADGPLTRSEQRALIEIGIGLGMAAPHINGVIAVAANQYQFAA